MNSKGITKKFFLPIFIIIFFLVAIFIGKTIYSSIYDAQVEKVIGGENTEIKVTYAAYECENDNSIAARGYVFLRGFGDHDPGAFNYQKGLIGDVPFLDFDYDENLLLFEISNDFVIQFNQFASNNEFEEIVIIGFSAGGIIASYSANKLIFSGTIELHTLASPLNGYHISDALLDEIQDSRGRPLTGFFREIGAGFDAFESANVKAYHHKNVEDEDLRSYCGDNAKYCEPLKIQNNNIPGSKEFFYKQYTHETIMPAVSKLIIDCHQ